MQFRIREMLIGWMITVMALVLAMGGFATEVGAQEERPAAETRAEAEAAQRKQEKDWRRAKGKDTREAERAWRKKNNLRRGKRWDFTSAAGEACSREESKRLQHETYALLETIEKKWGKLFIDARRARQEKAAAKEKAALKRGRKMLTRIEKTLVPAPARGKNGKQLDAKLARLLKADSAGVVAIVKTVCALAGDMSGIDRLRNDRQEKLKVLKPEDAAIKDIDTEIAKAEKARQILLAGVAERLQKRIARVAAALTQKGKALQPEHPDMEALLAVMHRMRKVNELLRLGKAEIYTNWPFDDKEAKRRQAETAKALGLPVELSVEMPGGARMDMVLIPAGEFLMGAAKRNLYMPLHHKVRITRPFYMGKYEVTRAQWQAIMGGKSKPDSDKMPMTNVSWNEIKDWFLPKLNAAQALLPEQMQTKVGVSAQSGWEFRMPTDAEWEYSCRAGTTTKYYFGDTISMEQANYNWHNKKAGGRGGPTPVGTFKANAWNLYDMHGNVHEWCEDYFWAINHYEYFKNRPPDDPLNSIPINKILSYGSTRVPRGGGGRYWAEISASAFRGRDYPDTREHTLGLRLVLSPFSPDK